MFFPILDSMHKGRQKHFLCCLPKGCSGPPLLLTVASIKPFSASSVDWQKIKDSSCDEKLPANGSLHTNAIPFMLKAPEWRKCCFYVKHINYKKTLVTAPLVKLNLTLRINNICSFSRCLRSKVWVTLLVKVKKN